MKTQIFPPPGTPTPSGFKIPSTLLIVGGVAIAAALIYFLIIKSKKKNGTSEKIYSAD